MTSPARIKTTNIGEGLLPVPFLDAMIFVTPDYYVADGIRMPVDAFEAEEIAERKGMLLPTVEMVDAIWRAAHIKLKPEPIPWNESNTQLPVFQRHHEMIEDQLAVHGRTSGRLIAGHKKDLVSPRRRGRVALYGWHRQSGLPIQPYSNIHAANYKDYSHGLRLVDPIALDKDGGPLPLTTIA